MKKFASYIIYTVLLACIVCACSDDLDIKRDYDFKVTHLPVPKRLKKGEVAEIRCYLTRSGYYKDARYFLRYFQPDGKGSLQMENGTLLKPNDSYTLEKDTFRLYYTSASEERQVIDLYFFDNLGKEYNLSFSFATENDKEDKE